MHWDLGAIEHHQQLWLVSVQPLEQAIERNEAGASTEDALEAGTQFATAPCGGFGAIRLEVIVEPPDQRAHALLRGAVQIGERVEFVDQPFCMHPAPRVPTANWPASSLTITISRSSPCTWTLPHNAPSAAMQTGSGVTCNALMPRRSRCVCQAA